MCDTYQLIMLRHGAGISKPQTFLVKPEAGRFSLALDPTFPPFFIFLFFTFSGQ